MVSLFLAPFFILMKMYFEKLSVSEWYQNLTDVVFLSLLQTSAGKLVFSLRELKKYSLGIRSFFINN